MKARLSMVLLGLLPWSLTWAQDAQVIVMTSYPQELINRYESAFETAYPDIDLVLEWRHADDAHALLEQGGAIDVYWAPTLDTFVILADAGYFAPLRLPLEGLPGRVGGLAIDDAQARFAAFEVAGFGVAYSEAWMAGHDVTPPADWKDLPASPLADSLLLPVPSRQGFSPMIYQSILSSEGWDAGWALIMELAAKGELMGSGGGSFIGELASGQRGAALSIDFFAKSARMGGEPVGFRYADSTLLSPAYVAQLARAPHPQAARQFIEFVLSDAGQALLLAPDVARLPVRPSAYPQGAAFNPFAADVSVPAFDLSEAESRLGLLAAVFDSHIGERQAQLKQTLAHIDALLPAAQGDALTRLQQARGLLLSPALDAAAAEALVARIKAGTLDLAALPQADWSAQLVQREQEIARLLE